MNVHAAVGAGKRRKPFRIREFLFSKESSMAEIARQLNLPHQTVSATVRGVKNNREVLKALRDMGCPLDALSLPDELKNDRISKAS